MRKRANTPGAIAIPWGIVVIVHHDTFIKPKQSITGRTHTHVLVGHKQFLLVSVVRTID